MASDVIFTGNGERGNGQGELDFVMMQGPLHEAWVQRKDLPTQVPQHTASTK